jgi:hypothetical protein
VKLSQTKTYDVSRWALRINRGSRVTDEGVYLWSINEKIEAPHQHRAMPKKVFDNDSFLHWRTKA